MVPVSATAKLAPLMPMSAALELLTQHPPACLGQRHRVIGQRLAQVLGQDAGDALAGVVHGGGDQVRRPFAGQLDDELTKVGLDDLQAGRFQGGVQVHFLRRHRLGFDDPLAAGVPGDVEHDAPGVLGRGGVMDLAAPLVNGLFQLFQVAVEVGERVLLDTLGVIAQLAAAGEGAEAAAIAGHQRAGEPDQGGLQRRIVQGLGGSAQEIVMLVAGIIVHDFPRSAFRMATIDRVVFPDYPILPILL